MKPMKTAFKNVLQLLEFYADEKKCREVLAQQRWNGKPVCPHCGTDKTPYVTNAGYKCSDNKCYKKFTVTVGTVFENSKIKLRYWFAAIYICSNHKKGISSHQLARDLGITQKSAWFILHRIRQMLTDVAPQTLTGEIEIDETYVGGREANKHAKKRTAGSTGRSIKVKVPVLGLLQRDGKVVAFPVQSTKAQNILPHMVASVAPGSTIHTDEFTSYRALKGTYKHQVVKHSSGEYVNGNSHTNSIEGFWSHLKRGIVGIYHHVSPKHLDAYCVEFAFRYNTRKQTNNERFFQTLTQSGNFVLPHKKLIGKPALDMAEGA